MARPAGDDGGELTGLRGLAGGRRGHRARDPRRRRSSSKLEEGEILVAPVDLAELDTGFGKVAAAVSDIGGIMCHAAIVAREYGLPAVVGTGFATSIKTGDRLRVDGDAGIVTILS